MDVAVGLAEVPALAQIDTAFGEELGQRLILDHFGDGLDAGLFTERCHRGQEGLALVCGVGPRLTTGPSNFTVSMSKLLR